MKALLLAAILGVTHAYDPEDIDPSLYDEALMDDTDVPLWERMASRAAFLEARAQPAEALALWERVLALPDPAAHTRRARERVAFLRERRDDDGTLTAWTALEQARLEFKNTGAEAARDRVVALLTAEGVASLTAAEARLWLARDALYRLKDPQQAHDLARPLWEQRDRWPRWVAGRAGTTYAKALARLGRWEEALAVQEGFAVDDHGAPRPEAVDEVRRELDLEQRRRVTWGVTGVGGLFLTGLAASARRLPPAPRGVLPLVGALVGAFVIAHGWQPGAGDVLPTFGAGALALHVLSTAALAAPAPMVLRLLARLTAATLTLAIAWLALDAHEQLAWMGW